jgi:dTDP-4-dehydrorhamnose reductase
MKLMVLVLGSGGQLGRTMAERLSATHEVVALSRSDLDVTQSADVRRTLTSIGPDVIINCTAYTNVDRAEEQPLAALEVNAWAVRTLARLSTEIGALLVHYSTDFVFDGETTRPYIEEDVPNPRNTYATTKLLGEWFAAETSRHYVLRVESLFGGAERRSTIDRMAASLRAGTAVRAFSDRTVSPTFVEDAVRATHALIESVAGFGLYHCVSSGWTTWAGVAREVARVVGAPESAVEEVTVAEAALAVSRPA